MGREKYALLPTPPRRPFFTRVPRRITPTVWTTGRGYSTYFNRVLTNIFVLQITLCISQFQLRPAPPLPSPGLLRGICPPCQSRGWGICKFCADRGPGICQPRGHSWAFDTHAVSYQKITTQKILLGKKADWHICQGQEKLKRFVKAYFWFYACISSSLIEPELHSEIGSYWRESKFFGYWINFLLIYYLKNILSYL